MPGASPLVAVRQSIAVLPRLVSTWGGGVPGNFSTTTATQSVTVKANDLVVVPCASGASTRNVTSLSGGTGISWVQSAVQTAASNSYIQVFTGRATTAETFTLTATFSTSSATVPVWFEPLVFEDVSAVGAVASHAGSTNASVSLTTTADYSAVLHIAGDFNGTAVAARTYSVATAGPATELAYVTAATAGQLTVGCDYYVGADVAGAKTIGFTAPSTSTFWSSIAIELLPAYLSQTVDGTGQGVPSGEAAGVGSIPGPLLSTVADAFPGPSIDTTKWATASVTGTATVSIVSGKLSMALGASSSVFMPLVTAIRSYDSCYVAITVPSGTINANWNAYLYFSDNDANGSQYKIGLINGAWNRSEFNGGSTTVTSLGVGSVTSGQTFWVRFRNTGTGDGSKWAYDSSPDGTTWTQAGLTTFNDNFDNTQASVLLVASTGTTAGTFLFDNFNTAPVTGSPQTLTGTGIATGEAEGVATVTSAITLAGTGIATAEAEGVAVVTPGPVTVTGTGVASGEAEGVGTVTSVITLAGTGIATGEAEGVAVVTPGPVTLTGTGVASAEAEGVATVQPGPVTVTGVGIATAEAEGVATVTSAITLTGTGVATAEAEGVAVVTPGPVTVTGTGIATSEAEGVAVVTPGPVTVTGVGVASSEAEGVATVTSAITLTGTGIATAEAEGVAVVTPGPVTVTGTGIATAETEGVATIQPGPVTVTGVGIATGEAEGVGLVSVVGGPVTVVGVGIATSEAVGVATVQPGPVTAAGVGIASSEAEGVGAVTSSVTLAGTGVASAEAEGVATVQPGPVTVTGVGVGTCEAVGVAALSSVIRIVGTGIPSAEAEGVGALSTGAVILGGVGVDSGEAAGVATISAVTLTRGLVFATASTGGATGNVTTTGTAVAEKIASANSASTISDSSETTTLSGTR